MQRTVPTNTDMVNIKKKKKTARKCHFLSDIHLAAPPSSPNTHRFMTSAMKRLVYPVNLWYDPTPPASNPTPPQYIFVLGGSQMTTKQTTNDTTKKCTKKVAAHKTQDWTDSSRERNKKNQNRGKNFLKKKPKCWFSSCVLFACVLVVVADRRHTELAEN